MLVSPFGFGRLWSLLSSLFWCRWGWDDHKRHPSIKLSRDGLTATCSGTSYHAVRASRGIYIYIYMYMYNSLLPFFVCVISWMCLLLFVCLFEGISRGKHFFQISVEQPTCGGSQSFGIANGYGVYLITWWGDGHFLTRLELNLILVNIKDMQLIWFYYLHLN